MPRGLLWGYLLFAYNFLSFPLAFLTNSFCFKTPCSEIIPVRSFNFVLSNGSFTTSIFLSRSSQTSFGERDFIVIFFVNFKETPQEYAGTPWSLASLTRVEVPSLFATSLDVNASAPNKKRSHLEREFSAAKSGAIITFIFDPAKSLAVLCPCRRGSTSVV